MLREHTEMCLSQVSSWHATCSGRCNVPNTQSEQSGNRAPVWCSFALVDYNLEFDCAGIPQGLRCQMVCHVLCVCLFC